MEGFLLRFLLLLVYQFYHKQPLINQYSDEMECYLYFFLGDDIYGLFLFYHQNMMQLSNLEPLNNKEFQAIHLGDVLEHLPNPRETLIKLISVLAEKGIIFIEGPLEKNHSLVYWSAKLFGHIKKMFRLNEQFGEPTHLIKVNEKTQLNFILELDSRIKCLHWEVYETGWPYVNNGFLRNLIAQLAIFLGGKKFFSSVMGNRFRGIFTIQASD